ncbi:MAG: hypothetical protein IJX17_03015 [Clostridia bacterium]|nr:hypothetical protein [Clostridia bacterium]
MVSNKIKTYISFAIKSRNIVYGVDDILKSKQVYIIFKSNNLAENSKNKLEKFILDKDLFIINLTDNDIFDVLQKNAIKVFAITDKNLADAIKKNFTNNVSNGGNLE